MNDADQLDLLTRRFPSFREEFDQFPPEPSDKTPQFYLNNPWFGGIDALALYCMVREFQPHRVLEVGSGFSTRVSLQAALRNENTRLICIEPYPDDPIRHDVLKQDHHGLVSVIPKKVQEVDLSQFQELVSGDILFIDSTHVSKIGSDVNYLVLEVLPRLNPGVIVHFHDIFLPAEYPRDWVVHQRRFFNEQYLLHAFLACNATYSVLLANHYFGRKYQANLRKVFPNSPDWEGTSFWIRRRAT